VLEIETPTGVVRVHSGPLTWTRGAFPDPEGRLIHVVTAYNASGRTASDAHNRAALAQLQAELEQRDVDWWAAAGGDATWTHVEPSVAMLGVDSDEARAIGATFGQEAIFEISTSGLRLISCKGNHELATGWTIERLAAGAIEGRTTPSLTASPEAVKTEPKAPVRRRTQTSSKAKSASVTQQRSEATAWGWPPEWPNRSFHKWVRSGHTAKEARLWSGADWTPNDLDSLLRDGQPLPPPPKGTAAGWRSLGADARQALQLEALGLPPPDVTSEPSLDDRMLIADWLLSQGDASRALAWLEAGIGPSMAALARSHGIAPEQLTEVGDLGCMVALVEQLGVRVIPGGEQAATAYPDEWFTEAGYITRLSQTPGLLMTAQTAEGSAVTVFGSGAAILMTTANGNTSRLSRSNVAAVPQILTALSANEFVSAGWTTGDVATLVEPWLDEWRLDAVEWMSTDYAPKPADEDFPAELVLAEMHWQLDDGDVSLGDDSGSELLVHLGPRYGVDSTDPGEWCEIRATDNKSAVAEFLRRFSSPGDEGSNVTTRIYLNDFDSPDSH